MQNAGHDGPGSNTLLPILNIMLLLPRVSVQVSVRTDSRLRNTLTSTIAAYRTTSFSPRCKVRSATCISGVELWVLCQSTPSTIGVLEQVWLPHFKKLIPTRHLCSAFLLDRKLTHLSWLSTSIRPRELNPAFDRCFTQVD